MGTVASIIMWHCHNVCTIHDKDTKLTSVFLKMSPNHSHKKNSNGCWGSSWNSKLAIHDCEPAIVQVQNPIWVKGRQWRGLVRQWRVLGQYFLQIISLNTLVDVARTSGE